MSKILVIVLTVQDDGPTIEHLEIECDGVEISSAGALAVYRDTGVGAAQVLTHLFADGQWLRMVRP